MTTDNETVGDFENYEMNVSLTSDTTRLQQAVWRLEDLLKNDDAQAWKEASRFLERLKKEQWQAAQPRADALEEVFKKVRAELCALPRYSYLTDAKGELRRFQIHKGDWIGFDAAYALLDPVFINAAIAAAKENK